MCYGSVRSNCRMIFNMNNFNNNNKYINYMDQIIWIQLKSINK